MAASLRLRPLGPAAAAILVLAAPAGAQEPDTAAAATDTAAVAADTAGAAADTARPRGPGLSFPEAIGEREATSAGKIRTWERPALLDASALTLADFLEDHAPGLLLLRSDFFFGQHHLMDGLWGPASVRVVVDGREVLPLEAGQPDLSRIALVTVDRIQIERRPGETVLRVTTVEHPGGEAYSRINAGTGQPSTDLVRGVFTNGAGRSATVAGAVDHLNVGGGTGEGSRLDALAKAAWMPFGPDFGVEASWRSESVERSELGELREFSRREFALRLRAKPSDGLQLDAWGATARRDPRPSFLPDPGDGGGGGDGETPPGEDGSDGEPPALSVDQVGASVTYRRGPARLDGRLALLSGEGLPDRRGRVGGGARFGPVVTEATLSFASWEGFSTSAISGGIALRPRDFPVALRAGAATGSRAVPLPGRAVADSTAFDFDAVTAGAGLELGPYRLGAEVSRQSQTRRPVFGGAFDRLLPMGPEATATVLEGRLAGPLVPLGVFEERVRVEGAWRSASFQDEDVPPYYVPRELARGEIAFRDGYFEDNLEVRLALRAERRGEMVSALPGTSEPVLIEGRTVLGSDLLVRIDVFRIWWRVENIRSAEELDFADLPYPTRRNVFGVRWEFFN